MQRRPQQTLAALLITASLAMPGAAHAALLTRTTAPVPAGTAGTPPVDPAKLVVSKEKAITIARNLFAIPAALGEPNVSIEQFDEGAIWRLQFESTDSLRGRGSISVGVDAETGSILQYSRDAGGPAEQTATVRYTRTEAAAKAQFWLDMLTPALRPLLQAVDRPPADYYYGAGVQSYDFTWERMAEGYPSRDDGVYIGIDAGTGELRNFHRSRWHQRTYKLPPSLLVKAEAEAIYGQLPMKLAYQYYEVPGTSIGEWRLVYRPTTGEFPMLGQDGKLRDMNGNPIDPGTVQPLKLVPAPEKPYKAPDQPLTRAEALTLARAVTGEAGEPATASYTESGGEQTFHTWNFTWEIQGKEEAGGGVTVEVDVDRGVVRGYNSWDPAVPASGAQSQVTEEQAREAAIQFIRTTRPDLAGSLMIISGDAMTSPYYALESGVMESGMMKSGVMFRPEHHVRFGLMKSGIPVSDRGVEVMVDGASGKVRNSWANEFSPADRFPSAQALITPAEAMASYLKQPGLELAWNEFWLVPMRDTQPQQQPPQLVWGSANAYLASGIDARSATLLDYSGRDLIDAAKRPADIAGHSAEREIELLWTRGILEVKDGKFNPHQAATAGDIARWLVMARGMSPYRTYDFGRFGGERMASVLTASPAAPYLGAALQAGIILPDELGPEANPDAAVSRQLLALWTARAMGYGVIAQMPNRIDMPFNDTAAIGAPYANAVGLLHGLGVVKGDAATSFEPQRAATRGEAAQLLFAVASSGFQR